MSNLEDRYEVLGRIGSGAMGTVHRGIRKSDARPVAIKVMKKTLLREPDLVARFEREIAVTRTMRHRNVVEVLDTGRNDSGELYLVMEFLQGRNLKVVIAMEAPIPPERVIDLGCQVAAGLAEAHHAGLVHRDLKPENVMVTRPEGLDVVKVFDFGLSLNPSTDVGAARLTAMDLRLGTPAFMAPEYIDSGHASPQSDLYALGMILYELAVGHPPFEGKSYRLLQHHLATQPPPLANEGIAPALAAAIHKMIRKDPADRTPTAAAAIEDLEASR